MANHIRTQQSSNGELRIWSWPLDLGPDYYGPKVTCEIRKVKLTEARRKELEEREERIKISDDAIRKFIP